MYFVIFHKKAEEEKVRRFCAATHMLSKGKILTFETQEWIPPVLGLTYYVKVEDREGLPERFREISIYRHPAVKPPYIYTVELGREWLGFVKSVEPDEKAKDA